MRGAAFNFTGSSLRVGRGEEAGRQLPGLGARRELRQLQGMPVSTTHVLSSGVAGAMAANRSGLQWSTLRNIAAAWIFMLPAAALLSGSLFWLFHQVAS